MWIPTSTNAILDQGQEEEEGKKICQLMTEMTCFPTRSPGGWSGLTSKPNLQGVVRVVQVLPNNRAELPLGSGVANRLRCVRIYACTWPGTRSTHPMTFPLHEKKTSEKPRTEVACVYARGRSRLHSSSDLKFLNGEIFHFLCSIETGDDLPATILRGERNQKKW